MVLLNGLVGGAVGPGTLIELAVRLGLSPQTLARQVAELLPLAIDYLTPAGSMPATTH